MPPERFRRWLLGIAGVGLAVRLAYGFLLVGDDPLLGDGLEFHLLANNLADGHGYAQPFLLADGIDVPTADKPPLYPLVLAALSVLGGTGWEAHQVTGALIGTGTVVAIGLLARGLGDARAGLVAAALAALHPALVAADGSLRSESLYALAIALSLLATWRLLARPGPARAAALGAIVGAAALTRGEALLLVALLLVPAAWAAGGARARHVAIGCAAAALVLAPWLVRCWIAFDRPVLVSTNVGGLLAGANCADTYSGPLLGQWSFDCLPPARHRNEALEAARQRDLGLDYAWEHRTRVPVVVAARVGRTWELFRPRQNAQHERFFEGRNVRVAQAGTAVYYALALLAVAGVVLLRRRGALTWFLLAPVALVTVVSASAYGFTRFRVAADVAITVLAAVALAAWWEQRRARAGARPAGRPAA